MCICLGHCSYDLLAITHESFKTKFTVPSISGTSDIWQKLSHPIAGHTNLGYDSRQEKKKGPNSPANRDKQRKNCYLAVILKQLQSLYLLAVKCCTVWECEGLVLMCITFICHLMTGDLP